MEDVEILATGPEFVKEGVRGIEPVIEEMILDAKDEIQMVAYVITSNRLLRLLDDACNRGVKITLIINRFQGQNNTIKSALKHLVERYNSMQIIDFSKNDNTQLHAKALVVDRKKGVIGSANFSWNGMFGNYEIGVSISRKHSWRVAKIIDILSNMGKKIS